MKASYKWHTLNARLAEDLVKLNEHIHVTEQIHRALLKLASKPWALEKAVVEEIINEAIELEQDINDMREKRVTAAVDITRAEPFTPAHPWAIRMGKEGEE